MADDSPTGAGSDSGVDVIVVGGGPAGQTVAARCAAGGLQTVLVERDLVGGESTYWACLPTKALLRPPEALAAVRRVPGARQAVTGSIDVAAVLARRDELVAHWDDRAQAEDLAGAGVTVVRGHARLAGPHRVVVESEQGDRQRLAARRAVVLAPGSSAALAPIRGLETTRVWDNRDAAEARQVPNRLIVLGGGGVGCELAQAFRRLGARVTLVEPGPALLAGEEPFAADQVRAALLTEGVLVFLANTVHKVSREGQDGPLTALITSGQTVTADELVLAVGRWPNTADLGLETVGLRPGEAVPVDAAMRATGVAGGWLYAVGDVTAQAYYTHMGTYQARIAADAALGRLVDLDSYIGVGTGEGPGVGFGAPVPRVVFTEPQVAAVGLTEARATEAGVEVSVVACPISSVAGAAVQADNTAGTAQFIVDRHRSVLVGATFTGPGVAELLHAATVAIVGEVPMARLRHAVPAFPTVSEVWTRLVEGYLSSRS